MDLFAWLPIIPLAGAGVAKVLAGSGALAGGTALVNGVLGNTFTGNEGAQRIDYDGNTINAPGYGSGWDAAMGQDQLQRARDAIASGKIQNGVYLENFLDRLTNVIYGHDGKQIGDTAIALQRQDIRESNDVAPELAKWKVLKGELLSSNPNLDVGALEAEAALGKGQNAKAYAASLQALNARASREIKDRGVMPSELIGNGSTLPTASELNARGQKWERDPDNKTSNYNTVERGIKKDQNTEERLLRGEKRADNTHKLNTWIAKTNAHNADENRRLTKYQLDQNAAQKEAELAFRRDSLVAQSANAKADRSLKRQLAIIDGERADRRARMAAFNQLGRGLANSMANIGGYMAL